MDTSRNTFWLFLVGLILSAPMVWAQETTSSEEQSKEESQAQPEEEVDVSGLEGQYWAAKDSHFNVVQNRLYKKEKKISLGLTWGPMINDQFSDGSGIQATVAYFFNERWGIELQYLHANASDNSLTTEFKDRFGVVPNHNKMNNFIGISGSWVPIYAKASLLNRRIIYYDLSLSAGIGMYSYDQQFTDKANETVSTPGFSMDAVQQFYLSHRLALRFSYSIRWYSQEIRDSRTPFDVRESGLAQSTFFMGGLVFFVGGFGGKDEKK